MSQLKIKIKRIVYSFNPHNSPIFPPTTAQNKTTDDLVFTLNNISNSVQRDT
jgi:hypothetical protein